MRLQSSQSKQSSQNSKPTSKSQSAIASGTLANGSLAARDVVQVPPKVNSEMVSIQLNMGD